MSEPIAKFREGDFVRIDEEILGVTLVERNKDYKIIDMIVRPTFSNNGVCDYYLRLEGLPENRFKQEYFYQVNRITLDEDLFNL